ncbi:type VI secretion system lipoprotein TssJ [Burkholderia sp. SRS-46]|nr:type VI secretion system lipoprotein TssJ [Burkholderia sp. SRS-46]
MNAQAIPAMHRIRIAIACTVATAVLSGCGTWQSVKETTVDATHAVFIAKVRQMNLVIESRAALNQSDAGQSLPVVVRVYQLKQSMAFETASYAQLLDGDKDVLKADLLGSMEATLGPGATVKLSAPMPDEAQYVGVVGFFRDQAHAEWQLVIPKSRWKKAAPVKLVVTGNRMELMQ